jgi:hypothetical protein
MAARGVHFAIPAEIAARLDPERPHTNEDVVAFIDFLDDHFQELQAGGWMQETDKAWDAIHRCLTDGTLEQGGEPEYLCILGATDYFWVVDEDGQVEWIVNLLDPSEVREAEEVIRGIDETELRRRYAQIDEGSYCFRKSEEDFQYTWNWFVPLQSFFKQAAESGRWVVFVADQ